MKKHVYLIIVLMLCTMACSDFDEQNFTVLLPEAGEDLVFFTDESGTSIRLDGSGSSDVNGLGFSYLWEVVASPEGFEPMLQDANTSTPTLLVSEEVSGRYTLSLTISRGAQQARDFLNVDVNPLIANVLLVNAIAGSESARLSIPDLAIEGAFVAPLSADETYYAVNLDQAQNSEGLVQLDVIFNGTTLSLTEPLKALGSYTLYLVGTLEAPEVLLVEKSINENTLPPGLVGLDAINLSPESDSVVLFIDATSVGFSILPADVLFQGLGISQSFGSLNFRTNAELFFPANTILPLPIWATVNNQRISNDAVILLPPNVEGNFGTFVLFPDPSSEFGNTLTFINNSDLLPIN